MCLFLILLLVRKGAQDSGRILDAPVWQLVFKRRKQKSFTCCSSGPTQSCLPRGQSISIKEMKSPERTEALSRVSECRPCSFGGLQADSGPRRGWTVSSGPVSGWQLGSGCKRRRWLKGPATLHGVLSAFGAGLSCQCPQPLSASMSLGHTDPPWGRATRCPAAASGLLSGGGQACVGSWV